MTFEQTPEEMRVSRVVICGKRCVRGQGRALGVGCGSGGIRVSRTWPGDSREGVGVESIQDLLAVVMRPWDFTSKDRETARGFCAERGYNLIPM